MLNGRAPVNFLASLDKEQTLAVEAIANRLHFSRKEYIFKANLTNNTIFILLQGQVKLFRLAASGHECIQWFCFAGEIFGLSENTYEYDNGLYAQAMAATDVYAIQKSDLNQLLTVMPSLAIQIIEQLTLRVRTLGDMLLHIACDDAYARLINLLQRLGSMYGNPCKNEIVIDIQVTHQDIADMIGVCRQTVSTMIARLKREGILSYDRRSIIVRQPASLARLAQLHYSETSRRNENAAH